MESLKKEIEGGIQCSGISTKFSTVAPFLGHEGNVRFDEIEIYFHVMNDTLSDVNPRRISR